MVVAVGCNCRSRAQAAVSKIEDTVVVFTNINLYRVYVYYYIGYVGCPFNKCQAGLLDEFFNPRQSLL